MTKEELISDILKATGWQRIDAEKIADFMVEKGFVVPDVPPRVKTRGEQIVGENLRPYGKDCVLFSGSTRSYIARGENDTLIHVSAIVASWIDSALSENNKQWQEQWDTKLKATELLRQAASMLSETRFYILRGGGVLAGKINKFLTEEENGATFDPKLTAI